MTCLYSFYPRHFTFSRFFACAKLTKKTHSTKNCSSTFKDYFLALFPDSPTLSINSAPVYINAAPVYKRNQTLQKPNQTFFEMNFPNNMGNFARLRVPLTGLHPFKTGCASGKCKKTVFLVFPLDLAFGRKCSHSANRKNILLLSLNRIFISIFAGRKKID